MILGLCSSSRSRRGKYAGKDLLLGEIPLAESGEDTLAAGFLQRAELGLPLGEPIRVTPRYVALNAHQVQQAYQHWLRLPDIAR